MRERRKKYLVQPRLQLLYGLVFLSVAGLYVLLQAGFLHWNVNRLEPQLPAGSEGLFDELRSSVRWGLLITLGLMVPLTLSLGIYVTHRLLGPLRRMESFLQKVIDDERPLDLVHRKGDELGHFYDLLNQATLPLRRPPTRGTLTRVDDSRERRKADESRPLAS